VTALLRAVGLTFGYPGREVLRDVSFSLAPGELVALCGPNGAGKSTLLRLLLGLHAPRAGHVELQGAPAASLTRREIARRAALLPQESPVELPLTVREVVALGRLPHLGRFEAERPEDVQAVTQALEATDTAVLADRPLTELSGGERHRAHFARALAQGAAVLLLDEPIAGHDLSHQLQALQLLRATVDGADGLARGAIVALHDLSLAARFCDRILLLDQGALRADAPPSEVLTVDTLARVFGVRAEVRADAAGRPFVIPISPVAGEESR
jgi:iron complex transport system ATP-binding protein